MKWVALSADGENRMPLFAMMPHWYPWMCAKPWIREALACETNGAKWTEESEGAEGWVVQRRNNGEGTNRTECINLDYAP